MPYAFLTNVIFFILIIFYVSPSSTDSEETFVHVRFSHVPCFFPSIPFSRSKKKKTKKKKPLVFQQIQIQIQKRNNTKKKKKKGRRRGSGDTDCKAKEQSST